MKNDSNEYKYSYDPKDASSTGTGNFGSWQELLDQQLSHIGRMVDDGINQGMDYMGSDVWQRMQQRFGQAMGRVHDALHTQPPTPAQAEADRKRRAARTAGRDLMQSAAVKRVSGWLCCGFGGWFTLMFGTASLMIMTGAISGELAMLPLMLAFTGLSGWMLWGGVARLKFYQFAKDLAALTAEEPVVKTRDLAAAMQKPVEQVKDILTKYSQKNWLNIWLDDDRETIYLDLASWQKARNEVAPQPEPQPQPDPKAQPAAQPDGLAPLRDFLKAIRKQRATITDDPQAVEELVQMEKTCTAILEWTEKHPESLPELRRLNQQYIPMTVKLLMTYNDLKLHDCDNADHVRQDIAGMLHALNQGFAALQDKMLDAVAMDVTGDIAALQGMLNLDGLSGTDFDPETFQQEL